ncbi:rhodanese-like domain-containing protein [Benzoatithermus flavus]|uniref:Rhodanese-like domain-containing protein n=1 Tax=Benzoatithermus flavus TaxID=3108223 RepID=A0ABU8XV45_9PROT
MRKDFWRALAVAGLLAAAQPASAQAPIVDAPTGQGVQGVGGVLIDIRTPREVAETGRPKGAVAVPLQGDDMVFRNGFVAEVTAAAGNDKARPVALIDANGQRAMFAAKLLASQGFSQVLVVGEGMLGSSLGPGWIARGLPVER